MNRRILLIAACFALVSKSFAQDLHKQETHAQIQERADALMEHARQLSDIRSPNAPAFRLKATFSFVGNDLETVQGTFTEIWLSKGQWRREIAVGALLHVEVGSPNRIWTLEKTESFPEKAKQIVRLMQIFPGNSKKLDFESIADRGELSPPMACAISKPGAQHERSAFCFEKKSGALLERVLPELRGGSVFDYSCDYGKFNKFGDFWFPREMACFEDRHKKMEAKVEDLSVESTPDPALFAPPPGAVELGACTEVMRPPVAELTRIPNPPFGSRDNAAKVTLSLVVDTKGKPQDVRVVGPRRKNYDESALSAVRGWRFKPGTCNGDPMPFQMYVEVDFRLYR
ncbi:MAG: TonB-like protein [Candidatus Sulfotelmatobacter sp.]|nr:TonB-like protein [Candidatus Sulfotelmatobacter sp.]